MPRADSAYGREHEETKARLLPDAYNTPCPRCGKIMLRGQDLDLGHSVDLAVDPNAKGDQIEHASCNRSAGAKLGGKVAKLRPSRKW